MADKTLYRVTYLNMEAVYEIYVRKLYESHLFGFLEAEEFVFGETSSLVVDPTQERLKTEFKDVTRTFIPIQSIIRIDEVAKEGIAKIRDKSGDSNKVSMFPIPNKPRD